MALVGNKLDLVNEDSSVRKIPEDLANAFAMENDLLFHECSAKDDINIDVIFNSIGINR